MALSEISTSDLSFRCQKLAKGVGYGVVGVVTCIVEVATIVIAVVYPILVLSGWFDRPAMMSDVINVVIFHAALNSKKDGFQLWTDGTHLLQRAGENFQEAFNGPSKSLWHRTFAWVGK